MPGCLLLTWDNVDLQKGTIHLRETKTGIERHVQLSSQAIIFLESHLSSSLTHHLFASRGSAKPITQHFLNEGTDRLRKLGKMLDIPRWTPHDLRRTVRTGLARLVCPSEFAEAVLGHSRKGIEGTYDLYSYDKECKIWLQKWADYLDTLKA
ncbi:tyrosine-type recombinase/integrase [Serratia sp. DD3]|uniref:tyrosine-type recombinase/integrase n=1 Tax=Serratia sp. DD3 TaxID=1410619 RepID=UPI000907711A